ncbi:MAG: Type 1 glutamine amidotransferase-like domain-containing protein [Clostridia bacterium]|nr:Type 1 glutamine amidotransferase-like domain-containing protein [Clostridia bacterium]
MKRVFVSIGGGELRNKTTAPIDAHIAALAKSRAGEGERGYALFFPTASHDSNPYFNSFRKTYTSLFDMKSDVAILTKGLMTVEHVAEKIAKANLIYVGGGDTLYLMQVWRETGVAKLVWDAYERGAVLAGLSAGAICWFDDIYTDSLVEGEYAPYRGLGRIKGAGTPHYNSRPEFDRIAREQGYPLSYAIEDDAAILFEDEAPVGALSSGGSAYRLLLIGGEIKKEKLELVK